MNLPVQLEVLQLLPGERECLVGRPGQRKSYQNTKSSLNMHFSKDFFFLMPVVL